MFVRRYVDLLLSVCTKLIRELAASEKAAGGIDRSNCTSDYVYTRSPMVLLGPIIVSLSSASESRDPTLSAAVKTRLAALEVSCAVFLKRNLQYLIMFLPSHSFKRSTL